MKKDKSTLGFDLLQNKPQRYEEPQPAAISETEGIDYGIVILPPVMGTENSEAEQYPADYIEYAKDRAREAIREGKENPLNGSSWKQINEQAEDGERELQRLADEADEAIRGTL